MFPSFELKSCIDIIVARRPKTLAAKQPPSRAQALAVMVYNCT